MRDSACDLAAAVKTPGELAAAVDATAVEAATTVAEAETPPVVTDKEIERVENAEPLLPPPSLRLQPRLHPRPPAKLTSVPTPRPSERCPLDAVARADAIQAHQLRSERRAISKSSRRAEHTFRDELEGPRSSPAERRWPGRGRRWRAGALLVDQAAAAGSMLDIPCRRCCGAIDLGAMTSLSTVLASHPSRPMNSFEALKVEDASSRGVTPARRRARRARGCSSAPITKSAQVSSRRAAAGFPGAGLPPLDVRNLGIATDAAGNWSMLRGEGRLKSPAFIDDGRRFPSPGGTSRAVARPPA